MVLTRKTAEAVCENQKELFSIIVIGQLMHVCQIARPDYIDAVGLNFQSRETVFTRAELCVSSTNWKKFEICPLAYQ